MWNYDGHIVVVAGQRFSATNPGSTFTLPNDAYMASQQFPCFAIVHQCAESTTGTPPTLVTPSGWTAAGTVGGTLTSSASRGIRFHTYWKIINAYTDLGTVHTGMNGTQSNRICATLTFFNRPLRTATVAVGSEEFSASTGIPTTLTGDDDSVRAPGHIWYGFAHGQTSISDGDVTMDTDGAPFGSSYRDGTTNANFGYGGASPTRTVFQAYPYNNSIMSDVGNWGHDVQMVLARSGDSGEFNSMGLIGFHFT